MRRLFVLAGILGGAIPAFAQTPPPVFDDSIVVTASPAEEPRVEAPAAISVVGRDEIEARQVNTVSDLLREVPGLAVAQSGSPGHATSLFTRGTESNHTLVLWNGVPLNEPFFGGYDWAFLPSDDVERVEVVRGPFSALYGSGALGGVVQVLAPAADSTTVRLEGGDRGYARGALASGHGFGPLHLELSGNLRRGQGELPNDRFDGDAQDAHVDWAIDPSTTLGLLLRRSSATIGIPLDNGVPSPRERQSFTDHQVALPLHGTARGASYEALLSENRTELGFRNPDDPFGFTASDTETRTRRARASGTFDLGPALRAALGADWSRDRVSNSSTFGVNLEDQARRSSGVFGQLHASLERLALDAGVRRDDDQFFGGHTSPRLGAVLEIPGGTRLRASYGEAFRAPSFSELFFPGSGNPGLRPETTRAAELGVEWQGERLSLRATGFENRLRDLIDFDPRTFTSVNVGRALTRGAEAEIGWRTGTVTLRANGTYLDAEDLESGRQLLRRPHASGNLLAQWRPPDWTLAATLRAVGPRRDYPDVRLPGYGVLDLAATWRRSALLQPYARIENALDRRYDEVAGYPAPRRRVAGGVALRF